MADTNTTEEVKKKKRRRKKKVVVPKEETTSISDVKEEISDVSVVQPSEIPPKQETVVSQIETHDTKPFPLDVSHIPASPNALGIGDISAYIASMKQKSGPKYESTPISVIIPEGYFASDGTDLKTVQNLYAIVPHSKGDHKLVFQRSQAPEDLWNDDKDRVKGGVYIKNGNKVYDVYVDFKRHPELKSKDGEHLDIWIIDEASDLEKQLASIKQSQGGGVNFGTLVIVGSLESTSMLPVQEEVQNIEDDNHSEEVQEQQASEDDSVGEAETGEAIENVKNTENNENIPSEQGLLEDQELSHEETVSEEDIRDSSYTSEEEVTIEPIATSSSVDEETIGTQEPIDGNQETSYDYSTSDGESNISLGQEDIPSNDIEEENITIPDIEITTDEETIDDTSFDTEIPGEDTEEVSEQEEFAQQNNDQEKTVVEYDTGDETTGNEDTNEEQATEENSIEAEEAENAAIEDHDAAAKDHEEDITPEENVITPELTGEQEQSNDDFWSTPVETETSQEVEHSETIEQSSDESTNNVVVADNLAADISETSEEEPQQTPESTQESPQEEAQDTPQLPSIDISDIVLEETKAVSEENQHHDSVLDTFKEGVDSVFHTHLHDSPVEPEVKDIGLAPIETKDQDPVINTQQPETKPLQVGVISSSSLEQLSALSNASAKAPSSSSKTPIVTGNNKKILLIIAEVLGILLLLGAAYAMYRMMFVVPDLSTDQATLEQPIPSKEKQLQDAIKQKSGSSGSQELPEQDPNLVEEKSPETTKPKENTGSENTWKPVEEGDSRTGAGILLTQGEFIKTLDTITDEAELLLQKTRDAQNPQAEKLVRIILQKVLLTRNRVEGSSTELSQEEMFDTIKRLETYIEQTRKLLE